MRWTTYDIPRALLRHATTLVVLGCCLAGGAGAEEPAARAAQAAERYREALEAEARGEPERARVAFEAVLAADPDHAAARRALGYERVDGRWLTGDELKRARGLVQVAGRWVSGEEAAALAAVAPAPSPTVERLDVAARVREALAARDAAQRARAVAALKRGAPDAARSAFEQALRRSDGTTRVRAAEALALLGDLRAAAALHDAWTLPQRSGVRGHFAQTAQRSFIQDYDVEVA